jgi:hypothetical protein
MSSRNEKISLLSQNSSLPLKDKKLNFDQNNQIIRRTRPKNKSGCEADYE